MCIHVGHYGSVPPPGVGDPNRQSSTDEKDQQKDEDNFEIV